MKTSYFDELHYEFPADKEQTWKELGTIEFLLRKEQVVLQNPGSGETAFAAATTAVAYLEAQKAIRIQHLKRMGENYRPVLRNVKGEN